MRENRALWKSPAGRSIRRSTRSGPIYSKARRWFSRLVYGWIIPMKSYRSMKSSCCAPSSPGWVPGRSSSAIRSRFTGSLMPTPCGWPRRGAGSFLMPPGFGRAAVEASAARWGRISSTCPPGLPSRCWTARPRHGRKRIAMPESLTETQAAFSKGTRSTSRAARHSGMF